MTSSATTTMPMTVPFVAFAACAPSQSVAVWGITCFREIAFSFHSLAGDFSALQAPCIKPESLQFHTTWPSQIDYSQPPDTVDLLLSQFADDAPTTRAGFAATILRAKIFISAPIESHVPPEPTNAYSSCLEFVSALMYPGPMYHNQLSLSGYR